MDGLSSPDTLTTPGATSALDTLTAYDASSLLDTLTTHIASSLLNTTDALYAFSAIDTATSRDAFRTLDTATTDDAPRTFVAVNTLHTLVVLFYVPIAHGDSPGKDFSNVEVFWWTTLSSFLLHFHRFEVVGLVLYCVK